MSLELTVCSRRRRRRAQRLLFKVAAGCLAVLALALALPSALGLSHSTVTDDAMSGWMERGAAVYSEPMPAADLKVGDVITYPVPTSSGERTVTRRIVDIEDGVAWTRGDATGAIDPWTVALDETTQSRVVLGVPYVGYLHDAVPRGARRLRDLLPH
jgi:hypothetical protein